MVQWYVELILQILMNYEGEYANRLIGGMWCSEMSELPWVQAGH
jgi:hypothetical protein